MIWIGGKLTRVESSRLELRESAGPRLTITRLAEGATAVYRASDGDWLLLRAGTRIPAGSRACVETLMDGRNLLALRVFLGAECGPA